MSTATITRPDTVTSTDTATAAAIETDQALIVATGDVIEFDCGGDAVTALVLLSTPEAIILDACDGSMPIVVKPEELGSFRVFDGATV